MKQTDYLSINDTKSIKGILVCMVLISHLHGRVGLFSQSLLGTAFSAFGNLAVSSFFFLSAFGLYESYTRKGKSYITHFFPNKILPYYGMCCVTIAMYLVRDLLLTGTTHWPTFFQSFLFGKTIVDLGWYLQALLVLYVIFFLVFRFVQKRQILFVTALITIYCGICAIAGLAETWYESVLCFAFGLLCAKHKDKVFTLFPNWGKWIAAGVGLGVIFIITLFLGNKTFFATPIRICIKMVSAIAFNCLVVWISSRVKLANPVTGFLGKYSFEIYVLQGMFLYGYRPIIENDWLYMGAVLISVIPLSLAAHPLLGVVSKTISSLWGKNREGVQ